MITSGKPRPPKNAGELGTLEKLNDLWYFQNASGGWVVWTGGTIPIYFSGPLVDRTVSIVQDYDVRSLLGIQVYVGYGRDELDLVQNHKYSAVYTVR